MQKKILCLFDYKANTGFGTVSKNIVHYLKKAFGKNLHLDIVAINYFGEPLQEDECTYVISAVKSATKHDDFGRNGFLRLLKQNDYDGIFIMQDLGVVIPTVEIMQKLKEEKAERKTKGFKSIFYFPVDSKPIPQLVQGLDFFDCIVTYTEYARQHIFQLKPELKGKVHIIPHGTNVNDFYPISREQIQPFRKEYFGDNADKFIITNINRNQPRKDIPTTIFAFVEAKRIWGKNERQPFLYLNMHPSDPLGYDLQAILNQTQLVQGVDYAFPSIEAQNSAGVTVDVLNKIYNASDVCISTTLGEGWGLSTTEAFACKVPTIIPFNTSFMEIGGYGSERTVHLETQLPYCSHFDNVIREQSDYVELAEKLYDMFKNYGSDVYIKKVEAAYNWAVKLEWGAVCDMWVEYFKQTFKISK